MNYSNSINQHFKYFLISISFMVLAGCKIHVVNESGPASPAEKDIPPREYSIAAVLWQQHSGEYRALAYQAFNLARLQLDEILSKNRTSSKPLAIVTDIDETILDNSPYSGKQIELEEDYVPERWTEWVDRKEAKAIPGALDFFNYAKSKNIEIFYITNRDQDQEQATLQNLKSAGFPDADSSHLLLRRETSGKKARRALVVENHEIVLLLGDNLSDFSSAFENKSTEARNRSVDSLKNSFGSRFIILPNAIYGDWETKGILEGRKDWTPFQKDSIRLKKVISY